MIIPGISGRVFVFQEPKENCEAIPDTEKLEEFIRLPEPEIEFVRMKLAELDCAAYKEKNGKENTIKDKKMTINFVFLKKNLSIFFIVL